MTRDRARRVAATLAATPIGAKVAVIALAIALLAIALAGLLAISVSSYGEPARFGAQCQLGDIDTAKVPSRFVPIYARAAERYRLGERGVSILIAIHEHESGFGANQGPSSAGAIGHMQFMPATWAAYSVDADGDGTKDPFDPDDAIFAAARYLRATGAPTDWYEALFAYNHADWYVQLILRTARAYEGVCEQPPPAPHDLGDLPDDPLARIEHVARWIEGQRLHYCWGGGHGPQPGPSNGTYCWNAAGQKRYGAPEKGLDCSGAVRWLLVLTGYPDPGGLRSDYLGAAYEPGPGRYVTIWSNPGHIFITINGRDWGTASDNYAHGPAFGDQPSAGFVATHPAGL